MKTLIIFWFIFCNCLFGQLPNQPDSVGTCTFYKGTSTVWGTLFEETNTYFVSCGHSEFHPQVGQTMLFGNGEYRQVETVWVIGRLITVTEFDLVIGKLNLPVNTNKSEAWWHLPRSFYSEKILTGFSKNGLYSGTSCRYQSIPDVSTDMIINTVPGYTFGGGSSGSPVWHKGKVIGVHIGLGGNESVITPLFMALIKNSEKFPEKFQTKNTETALEIKMIDSRFTGLEMNIAPGKNYKVSASADLSSGWSDADLMPEFYQFDEISIPWKRYYVFDTAGREKLLFRGESLP